MLRRLPLFALLLALGLALGLFLRLDFAASRWGAGPPTKGDASQYYQLARHWQQGYGFSYAPGQPSARRSPATPLFFALVMLIAGEGVAPLLVAQCLLNTLALWLLFGIGRRLGGRWAGLLALWGGALYPPFIKMGGVCLSESLAAFLVAAIILAGLRLLAAPGRRPALFVGFLLGLAGLCRPELLVLGLPLAAGQLLGPAAAPRRAALARIALIALVAAVMIAPWLARNRLLTGRWCLQQRRGLTDSSRVLGRLAPEWPPPAAAGRRLAGRDLATLPPLLGRGLLLAGDLSDRFHKLADFGWYCDQRPFSPIGARNLHLLFFWLGLALGLAGGDRRQWFVCGAALALLGTYTLVAAIERYSLTTMTALIPLAALLPGRLAAGWRANRTGATHLALAVLAAAAALRPLAGINTFLFCLPPGLLLLTGALRRPATGGRRAGWATLLLAVAAAWYLWLAPRPIVARDLRFFFQELRLVPLAARWPATLWPALAAVAVGLLCWRLGRRRRALALGLQVGLSLGLVLAATVAAALAPPAWLWTGPGLSPDPSHPLPGRLAIHPERPAAAGGRPVLWARLAGPGLRLVQLTIAGRPVPANNSYWRRYHLLLLPLEAKPGERIQVELAGTSGAARLRLTALGRDRPDRYLAGLAWLGATPWREVDLAPAAVEFVPAAP